MLFQYTHHIRGATDNNCCYLSVFFISIHAPHTWCDRGLLAPLICHQKFQYTHHIRGATLASSFLNLQCLISIHAPHTWCDYRAEYHSSRQIDFNTRTTYVVRPPKIFDNYPIFSISIHAPHTWCDVLLKDFDPEAAENFNTRTTYVVRP